MDPFELLKADHKKVAELFDQLETASGKRKLDVFQRIKSELELHTHIEETIFYPALEKPEETHDLTLEAYEEHKVVKSLLAELAAAKTANDEWQAKAKVLRENVEHHVEEEENELFDKADDALSDQAKETLGNRMAAEKAKKQGRPTPVKSEAKKRVKTSKKSAGIISKIADFVGLGGDSTRKAAKKATTKKRAGSTKSSKTAKRTSRASATKRAPTATAAKRARPSASSTSKKRSGTSAKKVSKKRSSRK
jgi:Hemerythrin HHE cation binding domain.